MNLRKVWLKIDSELAKIGNWWLNVFSHGKRDSFCCFYHWFLSFPCASLLSLWQGATALTHLSQGTPDKIHLRSRERWQIRVLSDLQYINASKGLRACVQAWSLLAYLAAWHVSSQLADYSQLQYKQGEPPSPLKPSLQKKPEMHQWKNKPMIKCSLVKKK